MVIRAFLDKWTATEVVTPVGMAALVLYCSTAGRTDTLELVARTPGELAEWTADVVQKVFEACQRTETDARPAAEKIREALRKALPTERD